MDELNDKILKDYLLGKCNEKETKAILSWLNESEEHAEHLFKLEELYHLGRFEKYTDPKRIEFAEKRLMNRIESSKANQHKNLRINRFLRYAAIIVIIFTTGALGYFAFLQTGENIITAKANSSVMQLTLPDGTKVWLNHHASLKYPKTFKTTEREVELNGEAYFDVTKNHDKPFIVKSKFIKVRVLGTAFNFNTEKNKYTAEVSLLRGLVQVEVNSGQSQMIITPGQKAVYNDESHKAHIEKVDAALDAVWHDDLIPLKNVNIEALAHILERFYHVRITIASNINKDMTFSGVIRRNNTIDSVLSALSYTVPIRFDIHGDNIHFTRKQ